MKRQANILSSVITNFETVEDVIATSMNSTGSAMAENEKWLDSIEGKTYQFTNALETMWSNLLNTEATKSFIDFGTKAVQFLDSFPGKITAIIAALAGLAKFKGIGILSLGKEAGASLLNYQQSLYKMHALGKLGFGADNFNAAAVNAYAAAVDGLTAKKQAEMLATAGLNKVQIIEVMQRNNISDAVISETLSKMNLTNTTTGLQTATVQEALATQLSADAMKQKAVADFLAANGNKTLNLELIQTMTNLGLISTEQAANIITTYGLVGANTALAGSFKTVGLAIKSAFMSNPVGVIMMAVSALLMFITLIKKAIPTTEKYVEKWDEVKDKLSSVNQELDKTKDRIEELESKGALSIVEKQELEQLRQTNDELERRKRLLEDEANKAAEKARASVKKDYEQDFVKQAERTKKDAQTWNAAYDITEAIKAYQDGATLENLTEQQAASLYEHAREIYNYMSQQTWTSLDSAAADAVNMTFSKFSGIMDDLGFLNQPHAFVHGETYIDQAIQKIQEYKNQLYDVNGNLRDDLDDQSVVDINANIDDLEADLIATASELYTYMDNYGGDASDPFVQKLQEQIDKIDMAVNPVEFYNKKFDEIFGEYSKQKVALYELSEQGKLTASSLNSSDYTPLMQELSKIGITAQDVADHINSLTDAQKQKVINPTFSIGDYTEGIDSIQEKISEYQSALQSLEDGSFTYSDFIDLTQKFPELADGVDTSSKSFNGLAKNLRKALRSSPEDLIRDLKNLREQLVKNGKATDGVDQLIDSLENLPVDAVADLSAEYVTLTDQINAAKKAQTELQAAMSENPNEGYETRGEAMEYMKDKMKRGEIGSESELWSVAEEYGFTYDSATSINENADALANFIAIREKWYKTDDDGNYTYKGTEDFIQSVENAIQSDEFKTAMESAGLALEDFAWTYNETTGQLDFDFDNSNWDSIISALSQTEELAGLTSEEFRDLLVQVGQYFNVEWENNADIVNHLSEIASGAGEATAKIKEYGEVMQKYFGADTSIDLTNRPIVSKTNMRGAGWKNFSGDYATVYSSTYSNEDGTKSVVVTPILPNGSVLSPEHLESYANDLLEGKEISPNVNIKLAEFDGEDSIQKAEEYAQALHEAQEEYFELRDYINKQLEEDSQTNLESGLTDDSLKSIQTLVSTAHDDDTGVTWLSLDELKTKAQEAGMDVNTLMERLKELQEAGKIVDMNTTEADPLGLESMISNAETTLEYLQLLGLTANGAYEQIMKLGGFSINLPNFVDLMVQNGWDASQISTYIQTLNSQGYTFTYTTEENKTETLNVNTEEGQAKVNELTASAKALTTTETLTVNLDGTAEGAIATIKSQLDTLTGKVHNVYVNIVSSGIDLDGDGIAGLNGTVHVNGTAHALGTAYKGGSWGAPKTETALVGELGPEMLVRNGRWTTIGDNGAEFTQIKKGDIIFNHKQTEDLLSKGYITGRGKLHGGAFAGGTAYVETSGTFGRYEFSGDGGWTEYDVLGNVVDSMDGTASALSNAADAISDASDEFKEVFDWIEVRIEELDETLGLLGAQLENATNLSDQNSIIDSMIGVNKSKMDNLIAGIAEYDEYAAKLLEEVPEQYREAAQNGAIAITAFTDEADEATIEAINNYRDIAQKGADLKQQLEELQTEIRDLAIQKFDNAYESGSVRATVEDSQTEKIQNQIDLLEEMGEIASSVYYGINGGDAASSTGMFENSYKKIEYLTNAREEMQKALNEAVEKGQVIKGSNEWYELIDQMYQIDSEIHEATMELEEFQNAINDIYWDNFDQLTSRLDYLKDETQSLIDLMDSDDLVADPEKRKYDGGTIEYWTADDVKWTDEGMASLGLYAQQMEIAEYTARQYAGAIDDLEKDYAAGLYSENEYIEKLNELKNSQYENIEAYYDAQDAIVDLNKTRVDSIKNGIEKEIDAYEELIEKQKEALDSEKDLYDFQKSVTEQQKSISEIERQLAALANDNSLSAAAKRKQLEAELAEAQYELQDTYYNRSVEDKQTALDKELEDFQIEKDAELAKWDEYLTNVEVVVADSLNIVQANALGVYDTLNAKAQEYDLTLSDAIMTPWQDGSLAVSDYQDTFDTSMSSTMGQLELLKQSWQEVIDKMTEAAEIDMRNITTENMNYTAAEEKKPEPAPEPPAPEPPKENEITIGGLINAGSARIYGDSDGTGGGKQYFGYDPIYKVLDEKNGYLLVRWHKRVDGETGWFKKSDVKAYAKGTLSAKKSGLSLIDELGEELQLVPGNNGRLEYVKKGTGIIPADLTNRLMNLAMNPQEMLDRNRPQIAPSNSVVNTEISIDCSVGTMVNIEHCDQNTLQDVEKIVNKAFDKHMQTLNNSIRRFAR